MAEKMRYNKIIDLLEQGKPVFSTSTVPNGSLDDLTYIADADYDAVIIEMEHEGFSFTTLRTSLQVLLNRKRIAEKGNHEQFPSRKAARRLGWPSRRPPPQKLAAAIICSTGWQKTCRSMPFDPNCSPTWRSFDPAPSWKPTGTRSSSRVDHRGS